MQFDGLIELMNAGNWPLWAQVLGAIAVVWSAWKALYWGPA